MTKKIGLERLISSFSIKENVVLNCISVFVLLSSLRCLDGLCKCHFVTKKLEPFPSSDPPNHTLNMDFSFKGLALYPDIKQRDWDSTQRSLKRETGSEKTEHAGK